MNIETLQNAQVTFAFASRLVYEEPDAEQVAAWGAEEMFDEAPFGMGNPSVDEGLELMGSFAAKPFDGAELRRDWFNLMLGAGVPAAPCWAGYHLSANAQILSEVTLSVRRLYESYGFEVERKNREPDDNLGILLGFLSHLIGMEAQRPRMQEELRLQSNQAALLERYVLPWIAVWRYDMQGNAKTDFMRGLGLFAFGLCEAYAGRFGWRYDPNLKRFASGR